MIQFTPHEKQILSRIGRNAYGKDLVQILEKLRNQVCSLDGVDRNRDVSPQVEGRLLFKDFADALVTALNFEPHQQRALEVDDYQ